MVAVTLLTCGREDYTRQTLDSFVAHNDSDRFALLHADDASYTQQNAEMARAFGFETVVQHQVRKGAQATRRAVVQAAAQRGASWVLMLENDWETVRSFPWALFDHVSMTRPDVYCLRLYGAYKERGDTRPCFARHIGKRQLTQWKPLRSAPEPAEVGDIHYGSPPSVTRIAEAVWLHDASSDRGAGLKSAGIDKLTVRVTENVVYHIGKTRTKDFHA